MWQVTKVSTSCCQPFFKDETSHRKKSFETFRTGGISMYVWFESCIFKLFRIKRMKKTIPKISPKLGFKKKKQGKQAIKNIFSKTSIFAHLSSPRGIRIVTPRLEHQACGTPGLVGDLPKRSLDQENVPLFGKRKK